MEIFLVALAAAVSGILLAIIFYQARWQRLLREKIGLESAYQLIVQERDKLSLQLKEKESEATLSLKHSVHWEEQARSMQERLNLQKTEIEAIQLQLRQQFENIAHKILEENTEKFSRQSQQNMAQAMEPLRDKLKDFEEKIRVHQKESTEQHSSLKEQLLMLKDIGRQMNEEARSLAQALKGDTKRQGSWGEMILERILESSGLEEGREYTLQGRGLSLHDEEGNRQLPDVIIHLPQEKHLIIDAKVSLLAYDEFFNTEEEGVKKDSLKRHVDSVKKHISGLSERYYQINDKLNAPDFVLMFLPVEGSFSLALQADRQLYDFAWNRKVIIVTPSTLLAMLKTVTSIWKYEKQNANAMEIARLGGLLYDQFVDFLSEMEKIKRGIDSASQAYDEGMKRLTGTGTSLLRRAERLRMLGVKSKKTIPRQYLDKPEDIILLMAEEEDRGEASE